MERKTRQRQVILETLRRESRPLNPNEILTLAREHIPRIGIATVYRTIREFEKEGKIEPVFIPNKGTYYEIKCAHHHDHFHCRICQKIYEVECPHSAKLSEVGNGFVVEFHEITYHGICPDCKEQTGQR